LAGSAQHQGRLEARQLHRLLGIEVGAVEKYSKPGTTRTARQRAPSAAARTDIQFWNAAALERGTVNGVPNGGYLKSSADNAW
jgi:hypothetical protein